jgi:hypothetical protein
MNKTTQEVARKAPRCALNVAASKPSYARGAAQGMINNGNVINLFLVLPHKVFAEHFEAIQSGVVRKFFKEKNIHYSVQEHSVRAGNLLRGQTAAMWESVK